MASFDIHQDSQSENENVVKKDGLHSKIPIKIDGRVANGKENYPTQKRKALGDNGQVERVQVNKRIKNEASKLAQKENVIIKKKDDEIDKDLMRIEKFDVENRHPLHVSVQEPRASASSAERKKAPSNPFFAEYSNDIMKHYKEKELLALISSNYMERQRGISWNHRSTLVDWLICVADEYKMSSDSLYLAVNIIDRFLSKVMAVREKLQLIGASAMFIAGKMEEIYPPEAKEWAYLTQDTYTTRQIVKMEQLILKMLKCELIIPTAYTFLVKFCADHDLDGTTTNLAMFLSELVLVEGREFLKYKPSEIAAASILHARANLTPSSSSSDVWPKKIGDSSGYSVKHLSPIVKAQSEVLKNSPGKSYSKSVLEKYSRSKFNRVARLPPKIIDFDALGANSCEGK